MLDAYEQQRVYRNWLAEAQGDLTIVEQALIEETRHANGPPPFDAVLRRIRTMIAGPSRNTLPGAA